MDLSLFSLEGKTALVTGVSRGLGQAMAAALAKAGADIVGVGPRGLGSTRSMIESAGRRAFEIKADLGAGDTAAAVAEEAIAAFGKIDILVNNAGIIKLSPAQEHTMEDFDAVMELNLRSLFLLTRDIARQMIALGACRPRPDPGLGQRVGPVQYPGQRHRARVHGHRQHRHAPAEPGSRGRHHLPNSYGPVGPTGGPDGSRDLFGLRRLGLCQRPSVDGGRRIPQRLICET